MSMLNPPHPGKILQRFIEGVREETGARLTIEEVARRLVTTPKTLSYLLNGKQNISPEMALRLAKAFPNTTPLTWMALQERYDLARAQKSTRAGEVLPITS